MYRSQGMMCAKSGSCQSMTSSVEVGPFKESFGSAPGGPRLAMMHMGLVRLALLPYREVYMTYVKVYQDTGS